MRKVKFHIEKVKDNSLILKKYINDSQNVKNEWDFAHDKHLDIVEKDGEECYVEPDFVHKLYENDNKDELIFKTKYKNNYLNNWPKPTDADIPFIWHLLEDYSQLRKAKEKVKNKVADNNRIKIAHIDTGIQLDHPALPKNLLKGKSFIDGERDNPGIDLDNNSFGEQPGHGTATISILAGGNLSKQQTNGEFEGEFGAIPFASILPIRICDTVALIRTKSLVLAIDYAISQGCEVITMSMAGAPTRAWAKIINKAYESGVVLVTAAGNHWTKGVKKLLPKRLLYPARWERVIAATGIASDLFPYVKGTRNGLVLKSEGGEFMQGNYGPKKAMNTAIAAFTPNTVWSTMNEVEKDIYFRFDGGGTSSATPQVAAAAALWISYNKDRLRLLTQGKKENLWMVVEAVKFALFSSANKKYKQYEKYYGQGYLQAYDALEFFPKPSELKKAKVAKVGLNGWWDFLGIIVRLKDNGLHENLKEQMFMTELVQLLHTEPDLFLFLDLDEGEKMDESHYHLLKMKLLALEDISQELRNKIESLPY